MKYNRRASNRAEGMLASYGNSDLTEDYQSSEVIADLIHLATLRGFDFERILERGRDYVQADIADASDDPEVMDVPEKTEANGTVEPT